MSIQARSQRGLPPSSAARDTTGFTKTYNSFSGVDMQCTFAGKLIGELQGLSYTVQREKAPHYTMGSADVRAFSRGKRGIAGSLVFQVFDRSALLEAMRDRPYIANRYDVVGDNVIADVTSSALEGAAGLLGSIAGSAAPSVSRIVLDKVLAAPQYLDQVLPFDIVITAANEYGSAAMMVIHGVELINCGSSMSIDDVSTEESCTWVATHLTPWHNQTFTRINTDGQSATAT